MNFSREASSGQMVDSSVLCCNTPNVMCILELSYKLARIKKETKEDRHTNLADDCVLVFEGVRRGAHLTRKNWHT